jgi:hypothetical protein
MRVLSWIVYVSCVDIRDEHGSFAIPRRVHHRIVRFEGETPWGET